MKKLFLALMAIAAIALTGCKDNNNNNDPEQVSEAQVKMQAAKDALGTDGAAFLAKMKEIGFALEQGSEAMYKKGNEFCYIIVNDSIVTRVAFYTKADYANFEVVRNYFAEYETACAKLFPDNFKGSCILKDFGAFFNDKEEAQFLNYVKMSLNPELFTSEEHSCTGESKSGNAERTLFLVKDEGEWLCRIYVDSERD